MNEHIKDEVRRLVQEELVRTPTTPTAPTTSHPTARSSSEAASALVRQTKSLLQNCANSFNIPNKSKNMHPHRFGKQKKTKLDPGKNHTIEVTVLKKPSDNTDDNEEYIIQEEMIAIKQALVILNSNMKESEIRKTIVESTGQNYPL